MGFIVCYFVFPRFFVGQFFLGDLLFGPLLLKVEHYACELHGKKQLDPKLVPERAQHSGGKM